jgi:hypothetical protein
MVGSALGAWWWTTQRRSRVSISQRARDRGTVIFDNTPVAGDAEPII